METAERPVSGPVVVLAGGTGGAKLARGMLDVVGDELVVIANTGDDVEIYGAYVSPDPDLVTFWLADRIDERGWGLRGDTFHAMEQLRELGVDVWFNLGDRDLAIGIERARTLREGAGAHASPGARSPRPWASGRRVLPMCDEPVRTAVLAAGRWWPLQEFMIRHGGAGPDRGRRVPPRPRGAAHARGARRDRAGAGDRDRSVEPGDLDRADPGDSRRRRGDRRQPGARWSRSARWCAGRVLKGPTAACMRVGRAARWTATGSRPATTG